MQLVTNMQLSKHYSLWLLWCHTMQLLTTKYGCNVPAGKSWKEIQNITDSSDYKHYTVWLQIKGITASNITQLHLINN